jgi:hypothetical protein
VLLDTRLSGRMGTGSAQPAGVLDVVVDVVVDLALLGHGLHPPGTLTHNLMDQPRRHRRSANGLIVSSAILLAIAVSADRTFPTGVASSALLKSSG